MSPKLYLVTCDLLQDGDYGSLRERLRTLGAAQVLNNQWALRTTGEHAARYAEAAKELVDDRDRIVVAEVGGEWASRRAMANLAQM